jgi:hypothetical protein
MAMLSPERLQMVIEVSRNRLSLYGDKFVRPNPPAFLELERDVAQKALAIPRAHLTFAAEALFVVCSLAAAALSVWMIAVAVRGAGSPVHTLQSRILAGCSLLVDGVVLALLVLDLWVHLHRRRLAAPDLRFVGPATVLSVWGTCPASLIISLLFGVLIAGTIGAFFQPLLLPLSLLVTAPALTFCIHLPFRMTVINIASSCIAYNSEGFLAPDTCLTLEPGFVETTMTPLKGPLFVRFADILDVRVGSSATTFRYVSRRNVVSRSSWSQRLFYATFSVVWSGTPPGRRAISFLVAPDV